MSKIILLSSLFVLISCGGSSSHSPKNPPSCYDEAVQSKMKEYIVDLWYSFCAPNETDKIVNQLQN